MQRTYVPLDLPEIPALQAMSKQSNCSRNNDQLK